jgi:cellulose biosynthesis protein BcsQ
MKIIAIFNNKGGVGKTTLTYHLAHALGEMRKKVLIVDLDPQCNLTIFSLSMERIHDLWVAEDDFIDDFKAARDASGELQFNALCSDVRSIHFLLKPTEDGTAELEQLPPPANLNTNVDLLTGRLTLHLFEAKVAERWSGIYQGDPLAIRTATRVRSIVQEYTQRFRYDVVLFDTSPSLGALNRNLLSLSDGFIVPCSPDLFSLYGIRNIGNALKTWKQQFDSIFHFLSDRKREQFPNEFVQFLGYTIYNARKYTATNPLNLAIAHYNYAQQIPDTIKKYIAEPSRSKIAPKELDKPIGYTAVIHSHNTLPNMAQKYHEPMWRLPESELDGADRSTIVGNRAIYKATLANYKTFAEDFLTRVAALGP